VSASPKNRTGSSTSIDTFASAGEVWWSSPCRQITKPIKSATTRTAGSAATAHERPHTIHSR
jgi:hypothetical protein